MKIAIIITGDEIMKGDLRDSNSYYLIQQLSLLDISPEKISILGDNLEKIAKEIKDLSLEFDFIIINGGLGPTIDDYTSEALALAFNLELIENKEAKEQCTLSLKKRGRKITPVEKKQAMLPKTAQPIFNEVGIAPGIFLQKNKAKIFCTPGVPSELYRMFSSEILPEIKKSSSNYSIKTLFFRCFGVGESQAQEIVNKNSNIAKNKNLKLGFRAHFPYIDIKIKSLDKKNETLLKKEYENLKKNFHPFFLSSKEITMEGKIVNLLTKKNKKITFVESCTGGRIASAITSVAGASKVFESGFVLYQNTQKENFGVSKRSLLKGAVSQEVVSEMLITSLSKTGADYSISVSGIAGPSGGNKEKPVGTVWISWGTKKKINTKKLLILRDRKTIQVLATYTALDLLRRELLQIPYLDKYSFETKNES